MAKRKYTNTKTPESERDEARTPPWLFKWLDSMYHFDVDLANTQQRLFVFAI